MNIESFDRWARSARWRRIASATLCLWTAGVIIVALWAAHEAQMPVFRWTSLGLLLVGVPVAIAALTYAASLVPYRARMVLAFLIVAIGGPMLGVIRYRDHGSEQARDAAADANAAAAAANDAASEAAMAASDETPTTTPTPVADPVTAPAQPAANDAYAAAVDAYDKQTATEAAPRANTIAQADTKDGVPAPLSIDAQTTPTSPTPTTSNAPSDLQELAAKTNGPSFDCSTVTNPTAVAICGNAQLSQLDRQMAILYYETNYATDTKTRAQQRQWIKERNKACGADVDCLRTRFNDRIMQLQQTVPAASS